jgi:hypothetical protein
LVCRAQASRKPRNVLSGEICSSLDDGDGNGEKQREFEGIWRLN